MILLESVGVRLMNLDSILQSERSQKRKQIPYISIYIVRKIVLLKQFEENGGADVDNRLV